MDLDFPQVSAGTQVFLTSSKSATARANDGAELRAANTHEAWTSNVQRKMLRWVSRLSWIPRGPRITLRAVTKLMVVLLVCFVLAATSARLYGHGRFIDERLLPVRGSVAAANGRDGGWKASGAIEGDDVGLVEKPRGFGGQWHRPPGLDNRNRTTPATLQGVGAARAQAEHRLSLYDCISDRLGTWRTSWRQRSRRFWSSLRRKPPFPNAVSASPISPPSSSSYPYSADRYSPSNTDYPLNETIHTASPSPDGSRPIIAKVTMLTGDDASNAVYERAIQLHADHSRRHRYHMFVGRRDFLRGTWNKHAYLLHVLLREIAKPVDDRPKWLFWVDADTVVLNANLPLEMFLPPAGWEEIHLIAASDWNGLNGGAFFIEVCAWSIDLLSTANAMPFFRPEVDLGLDEQTAMQQMMEIPEFRRHSILMAPQRWFNAYPAEEEDIGPSGEMGPFHARPGDFLVHFAGLDDKSGRMVEWMRKMEQNGTEWEADVKEVKTSLAVRQFWGDMWEPKLQQQKKEEEVREQLETLILKVGGGMVENLNSSVVDDEELSEAIRAELDRATRVLNNEDRSREVVIARGAIEGLERVSSPFRLREIASTTFSPASGIPSCLLQLCLVGGRRVALADVGRRKRQSRGGA